MGPSGFAVGQILLADGLPYIQGDRLFQLGDREFPRPRSVGLDGFQKFPAAHGNLPAEQTGGSLEPRQLKPTIDRIVAAVCGEQQNIPIPVVQQHGLDIGIFFLDRVEGTRLEFRQPALGLQNGPLV